MKMPSIYNVSRLNFKCSKHIKVDINKNGLAVSIVFTTPKFLYWRNIIIYHYMQRLYDKREVLTYTSCREICLLRDKVCSQLFIFSLFYGNT